MKQSILSDILISKLNMMGGCLELAPDSSFSKQKDQSDAFHEIATRTNKPITYIFTTEIVSQNTIKKLFR
jgi:hypothetical protein